MKNLKRKRLNERKYKNWEELPDADRRYWYDIYGTTRLGVADVKAFGLTWEDCEQFLNKLGYAVRVEIAAYLMCRN